MAISLGDIILYLGADDSRLNGVLKGVEGKAQGWVNSLGGKLALGLGAAVTTAIGGATALGLAAFQAGEKLDAAYDTLIIKSGASGEALTTLQGDLRSVFSSVPTDAGAAADVLALLYQRLNLTGEGAQNTAKQILEMSRMMGVDATAATEAFTRMMKDAGLSSDEASGALDKIFVASQKSGIGIDRLMQLATQFGSPMRLMGFSLDDSIALLAKWEKEGVNTELVMGSLRIAAGKFADEGKPLKESLMSTFEAIKNNKDATAALALGMDVFGARAGPDMVAAIREGRFEIDDMIAALQGADGAISETSKKTQDWGEKLKVLKNKATLALEPIGAKLLDVASMLLDKAGPALDWFSGILETYVVPAVNTLAESLNLLIAGDVEGALANLFGEERAAQIMSFAQTLGDFLNNVLIPFAREHAPEIKAALIAIGVALGAAAIVSTVMGIAAAIGSLLNPVGAVIAVVALLAAAWAGNWGGIQEKTFAAIEWLKTAIAGGMQFIRDFVNGDLGLLSQIFSTAWQNIQLIFQAFQAAFHGDWYRFGELLRQVWDNSWQLMGTILTTAWDNIKTGVKNGIQSVKDFFTQTNWSQVGTNILDGIGKGISSGASILGNALLNAAKAALQAVLGFFGGGGSSSTATTPPATTVKHRAGGGSVQAGMPYIINEMGPELFVPNQSGSIIPNAALGTGGGAVQMTYVDQRFISLSDEFEAERVLTPIIARIFRSLGAASA